MRTALSCSILLLALTATLDAGVLKVDPSGAGGAFVDIQSAVSAAVNDDIILVRSGSYGHVIIDHKGVTIAAEKDSTVQIDGGVWVRNTLIPHRVVLRALVMSGKFDDPSAITQGLRLTTARGPVRVEQCVVSGADATVWSSGNAGAVASWLDVALDASFSRTIFRGGDGHPSVGGGIESKGGDAVNCEGAVISLHECVLAAGLSPPISDSGFGAPGGHGLIIEDHPTFPTIQSTLHAAGSRFIASDGSTDALHTVAGDGGNGLIVSGATTTATLLDNQYFPGKKGPPAFSPGKDGVAIEVLGGATVQQHTGMARAFAANSPVREKQLLTLELTGEQGDLAFLLYAAKPEFASLPLYSGVLLLELSSTGILTLGTFPIAGTLIINWPLPLLPPAAQGVTIYVQSLHQDTTGKIWLGGPSTLVLVDETL